MPAKVRDTGSGQMHTASPCCQPNSRAYLKSWLARKHTSEGACIHVYLTCIVYVDVDVYVCSSIAIRSFTGDRIDDAFLPNHIASAYLPHMHTQLSALVTSNVL
jgi:hypothetical protein